jgi:hypothetical protein
MDVFGMVTIAKVESCRNQIVPIGKVSRPGMLFEIYGTHERSDQVVGN